jgi:hypothetical protein
VPGRVEDLDPLEPLARGEDGGDGVHVAGEGRDERAAPAPFRFEDPQRGRGDRDGGGLLGGGSTPASAAPCPSSRTMYADGNAANGVIVHCAIEPCVTTNRTRSGNPSSSSSSTCTSASTSPRSTDTPRST